MESQGLQTYSSFLHENRKELTILLLLGALAGAAYYLFSLARPDMGFEKKADLSRHYLNIAWKVMIRH